MSCELLASGAAILAVVPHTFRSNDSGDICLCAPYGSSPLNYEPVNFLDAWGLEGVMNFLKGLATHFVSNTAAALTDQTPVPSPVYDAVDEVLENASEDIRKADEAVAVSVTARAVSPATSMTVTITEEGDVVMGGGLASNLAASATVDVSGTVPVPSPFDFSLSIGGSTSPSVIFPSLSVGGDITWNENGLTLSVSMGVGVGFTEGHVLITDNVSKKKCEKLEK